MDIFLYYLSQTSPEDDIVPVCMIRHLSSILKGISTLGSSQTDASYRNTLIHIAHFRILAYMTDEHDLVHSYAYLALPIKRNLKFLPLAEGN